MSSAGRAREAPRDRSKGQKMKPMTAKQYREALDELDLTQDGAAEFLGVSLRSAHGYANGAKIPHPVATLLRLMTSMGLSAGEVTRRASR